MSFHILNVRDRRIFAWLSAALLVALITVVGPASVQANAATTGVSNEAQLRSALTAMSSNAGGDHTINITADFSVSDTAGDPFYNGSKNLTINGHGHTVSGTDGDVVRLIKFNSSAKLTIKNLTASGFTGYQKGGVIFTIHGDVDLVNSTFSGNIATPGTYSHGGVLYDEDGDVRIEESSFIGNHVAPTGGQALGGAVYAGLGLTVVRNSKFVGNYADGGAGSSAAGALLAPGLLVLSETTFDGNYATSEAFAEGGAIVSGCYRLHRQQHVLGQLGDKRVFGGAGRRYQDGKGRLSHQQHARGNSVSGPRGWAFGGAVDAAGWTRIFHATMSANSAADGGAHVHSSSDIPTTNDGTLKIQGSVLVDAIGSPGCDFRDSTGTSDGHNFVSDRSCFSPLATDTVGGDPGLDGLADNDGPTKTMAPSSAGSPLVDAIPAKYCQVITDQRGAYRPSQGRCDIGAVELQQSDAGLVVRLAGLDRYETAVAISNYHHPFGSKSAYVSTGSNFPDALAGAAAAAREGAPLLLTGPTLPDPTANELYRLDLTGTLSDAILLGGTGVVTPAVNSSLRSSNLATTRLAGANRYETAVAISKHSFPTGAPIVFVATGSGFADALAGGPAAAALGGPVLLTSSGSVPKAVSDEIARLSPDTIVVLGGTGVVSKAVYKQLSGMAPTTVRLGGADRYETAVAISKYAFPNPGDVHQVYIATGENFPDALAGAAEAAAKGVPILLTRSSTLPSTISDEIDRLDVSTIYVLGGKGVVSNSVANTLKTHIGSK